MTDLQWLYAVLVLLYLLECLVWLRRGGVAWVRGWSAGWRMTFPSGVFGNARGGLVVASPLPSLKGAVLVGAIPPLTCGFSGVLVATSTRLDPGPRLRSSGVFLAWDAMCDLRVRGKRLCLGDTILSRFGSEVAAWETRSWLRRLAKATESDREALLESWVGRLFDRVALEERWRLFQCKSRRLSWCCGVNFLAWFGLLPLGLMVWGLERIWPMAAATIAVLSILTFVLFRRAHRDLYPAADEERFVQGLMILLSPPLALRAVEILGRPLTESWHPLTLAVVFGDATVASRLGRRVIKELRWPARPVAPSEPPAAAVADQVWRDLQLRAAERLLREESLDPADLVRSPAPEGPDCRTYCPRCDAQFTTLTGACCDCGGIPLERLDAGHQPVERSFPPAGDPG